jgi:hypothetical protein
VLYLQRALGSNTQMHGKGKAHYIEVVSDDEEEEGFTIYRTWRQIPQKMQKRRMQVMTLQ